MGARLTRVGLRVATLFTLLFLYAPIFIVVVYAFNDSRTQAWNGLLARLSANGFFGTFSLRWFDAAIKSSQVQDSFMVSVEAAVGATVVALILGSAAAFAV